MPDRERKRVSDHRFDALKGSFPQGPPAHPRNTEYLQLSESLMREGEKRWSNSERYGGAAPETVWKKMRAILICFSARRLVVIQLLWKHRVGGCLWLGFCHWQSAPMCLALMLMPMATLPTAPVWVRTYVDPSLAPLRLLTLASGYVALCVWLLTLMPVAMLPYALVVDINASGCVAMCVCCWP